MLVNTDTVLTTYYTNNPQKNTQISKDLRTVNILAKFLSVPQTNLHRGFQNISELCRQAEILRSLDTLE